MAKERVKAIYENGVLRPLEPLSLTEHTEVELTIEGTVRSGSRNSDDPVLQLIGAYQSERPLIDGIPVSEDPNLYLLAEMMGEEASDLHAWEIAPQRYRRGKDGQPIRIEGDEN